MWTLPNIESIKSNLTLR